MQIIQLQKPPYIRLNSKHLPVYKIWSEREAVLMCKNVLKWMVSNFISPMLRLLPSFEGGGAVHMLHSNMSVAKVNYMHDFNTIMNFKHFSCAAWRAS